MYLDEFCFQIWIASPNDCGEARCPLPFDSEKFVPGTYTTDSGDLCFIENVGEVEVSQTSQNMFSPYKSIMGDKARTLPILKHTHSNNDRYTEFLKLCDHVECLVDMSVQEQFCPKKNNMISKALTRKTRKALMKDNEKGDINRILRYSNYNVRSRDKQKLNQQTVFYRTLPIPITFHLYIKTSL